MVVKTKNDFVVVGLDKLENPYANESNMFTAPVNGIYKWSIHGIKLVKRLKKGESIDLDKYKEQDK